MWRTNLNVLMVVLVTVTLYTLVAAWIPQIESEVPEELTFTGEVTTDELVEAGERLYEGPGGCVACHGLGTRAPNLLAAEGGAGPIGARCDERVPGLGCKEYLHASMIDPGAYIVEGYQNIMPDMRRTLSDAQIWSIVAFLQSQGGEVTVEASDIELGEPPAPTTPASAEGAGTSAAAGDGGGSLDPVAIFTQHACQACHQLGGEGGAIGPPLDGLGARRDADHIRRSILEPNADTTAGYEGMAGTMPANFGQQMTAAQLEALVRFLAAQEGS